MALQCDAPAGCRNAALMHAGPAAGRGWRAADARECEAAAGGRQAAAASDRRNGFGARPPGLWAADRRRRGAQLPGGLPLLPQLEAMFHVLWGCGQRTRPQADALRTPPASVSASVSSAMDAAIHTHLPTHASAGSSAPWRPRGLMVMHLAEHRKAINRLAVAGSGAFFASASGDGTVKVWDCRRLERDVAFRSRLTYATQVGCRSPSGRSLHSGGGPHAARTLCRRAAGRQHPGVHGGGRRSEHGQRLQRRQPARVARRVHHAPGRQPGPLHGPDRRAAPPVLLDSPGRAALGADRTPAGLQACARSALAKAPSWRSLAGARCCCTPARAAGCTRSTCGQREMPGRCAWTRARHAAAHAISRSDASACTPTRSLCAGLQGCWPALAVDAEGRNWLVCGSTRGQLSLWDMRFQACFRTRAAARLGAVPRLSGNVTSWSLWRRSVSRVGSTPTGCPSAH